MLAFSIKCLCTRHITTYSLLTTVQCQKVLFCKVSHIRVGTVTANGNPPKTGGSVDLVKFSEKNIHNIDNLDTNLISFQNIMHNLQYVLQLHLHSRLEAQTTCRLESFMITQHFARLTVHCDCVFLSTRRHCGLCMVGYFITRNIGPVKDGLCRNHGCSVNCTWESLYSSVKQPCVVPKCLSLCEGCENCYAF